MVRFQMTETENSFDLQNIYQPHYNPPIKHSASKREDEKKKAKVRTPLNHQISVVSIINTDKQSPLEYDHDKNFDCFNNQTP